MRRYLLIIDEAQLAYSYTPIWNDLIKSTVPGRGPLIVLFSSYGSPSNWLLEVRTPTPFVYPSRQRVSLRPSKDNPMLVCFSRDSVFASTTVELNSLSNYPTMSKTIYGS